MTPQQIKNIQALDAILAGLNPGQFKILEVRLDTKCGTVACIAGWATTIPAVISGLKLTIRKGLSERVAILIEGCEMGYTSPLLGAQFGFDDSEWYELVTPWSDFWRSFKEPGQHCSMIGATQARYALRHFRPNILPPIETPLQGPST